MTKADHEEVQREKRRLRQAMRRLRRELADKDERSREIMQRVSGLEAFQRAGCVLFYVDMGDEVRTRSLLADMLTTEKQVGVPYCIDGRLEAVHLKTMLELHPGAYGILEPNGQLRIDPDRRLHPEAVDIVLVPGVAFDRDGRRLGQGKGYYDKLLKGLSSRCLKVGLAYDRQLVERVPVTGHDVQMDLVITETGTIDLKHVARLSVNPN